jgi:hypothetical protein
MARRYNRDSRGRFASGGGGGGSKRPAARGISRGTNRLTRDNSGRITSVGGDGATARGGRLRTASGNQRATQTARISGGRAAGTVTRSGARRTAAAATTPPSKLKRSGKTIKIAQKKAPTPTKEDKSIEKVRNLKAAQPAFGRGQSGAVFIPDKALTPKRRQSLGLSAFASRAESQRWSVSRQQFGSQSGVLISERGGYKASLPKQRQGVIKRPTTRAAAAAVKPVRRTSLRFTKQSSTRTTAELSGGNRINIAQQGPRSFRASLVGKSGSPKMERSGFRNISEAKKWAANPNARGPRLMGGGLNTEASAKATWRRAPRIASTIKLDRPRKRRS